MFNLYLFVCFAIPVQIRAPFCAGLSAVLLVEGASAFGGDELRVTPGFSEEVLRTSFRFQVLSFRL